MLIPEPDDGSPDIQLTNGLRILTLLAGTDLIGAVSIGREDEVPNDEEVVIVVGLPDEAPSEFREVLRTLRNDVYEAPQAASES